MTDRELMQQALEKLEFFERMRGVSEDTRKLITALSERLAQPEQEPWVKTYCGGKPNYCTPETAKRKSLAELLDSTPVDETVKHEYVLDCPRCGHCCQQREWVGFTDGEKNELVDAFYGTDIQLLEAVEAKLKEKNGG